VGKPVLQSARIPAKASRLAEALCAEAGERLTEGRRAVYAELAAQDRPLSAYDLLALLEKRQQRKIAPLTVYRHLDFLIRVGLIHRLESNQSYLPCTHPEEPHESCYLVCSTCGTTDEFESEDVSGMLKETARKHGFETTRNIIELEGTCRKCATRS